MNKKQELRLKYAAASLSRADQNKGLQDMATAHQMIQKTVAGIYKSKIDVPLVLRVERILNEGHANVLGKSQKAYAQIEMLTGQAETGQEAYEKFMQAPRTYVEYAEATRKNVTIRGIFLDGVPNDPVRYALGRFRSQLATELTQRGGDPFADREQTNRIRHGVTVKAERAYLEAFLDHRDSLEPEERERKKERHLDRFDKRIARESRHIAPQYELPQQDRPQRTPR